MKTNRKAILIVLDGVGIGALPDAHLFGDEGANTLRNISLKKPLSAPNLEKLGLGNVEDLKGIRKVSSPKGFFGKMMEKSKGKDSTTGHWELAGIIVDRAFATFPDGFPMEIIDRFKKATGCKEILGNRAASGTTIIEELGEEHIRTGYPIVYTSADSVFQIAACKEIIPLESLYDMCIKARKIADDYDIGRVIARPFVGKSKGQFQRTPERRDYSVIPPEPFLLTYLLKAKIPVTGVGKIDNLFADVGVPESTHTKNNADGIETVIKKSRKFKNGLVFANLIDFDMLYGHRQDVLGFHQALAYFDENLPRIIETLGRNDILIISADHGTDPTTPSTDHSREHVPLIVYTKSNEEGKSLGIRQSFSDVAQTLAEFFGLSRLKNGESFYRDIWPK
jgi:phosphopentomutase